MNAKYRYHILQTVENPERQISIHFNHYHEIKEALEDHYVKILKADQFLVLPIHCLHFVTKLLVTTEKLRFVNAHFTTGKMIT